MKVAVLTGGGDCPGLNAAIRAVVRKSVDLGYQVIGVKNGWLGLLNNDLLFLDRRSVSGILPTGGTMLGTSRTNPARVEGGYEKILKVLEKNYVSALVAIGGEDTLGVAKELWKRGFFVVGVPKTMDNDLSGTDFCIGFDSAVSIVSDALDKLHTTASAHHRVMVVEVMGRDTGWVALVGGLAGGADYILIPEVPATIEDLCAHLHKRKSEGKDFSIVVVSEGVSLPDLSNRIPSEQEIGQKDAFGHVRLDKKGIGEAIAREVEARTGFETRVTVLGHLQRGGSPTLFDRVLATRLGVAAVELVREGKSGRMVALQCNAVTDVSLDDAVAKSPRPVDPEMYKLATLFY